MNIEKNLKNIKKLSSNEIDFIYCLCNDIAHGNIELDKIAYTEYDFKKLNYKSIADNIADKLA